MKPEYILIPFWLVFAVLMGRALYTQVYIILPALKKYGRDHEYSRSLKKQRAQLNEYTELCKEHDLADIHWRYLKFFTKVAFVMVIVWFVLIYVFYFQ